MPGTGIWLSDSDLSTTGGAIWAQQQIQALGTNMRAGQDWAAQQIARAQQQAQAQLQSAAQTPVAPTIDMPAAAPNPTPQEAPPLPPAAPQPAPAPEPPPAPPPPPSPVQAGQDWAQQQVQNLLGPMAASQQSPLGGPTAIPAPQTPSAPPATPNATGVPAGPQSAQPGDFIDQARQAAQAAGIDPDIFSRQIQQESGFNPSAVSPAGAQGIAQFMPQTAAGLGLDPSDPIASLKAAAQLDAQNLKNYGGDWASALTAYNAGPGNVPKGGGVPDIPETQNYVQKILGGAQNVVQQGLSAVNNAVDAVHSAVARVSQFGLGLSSGDAMAFCGPAAALAFAQTYGRNPTVDEAKQLAQQVGWDPSQGMAGPQSEVKLLNAMGVDAHMTNGVDWQQVGQSASTGSPVIVDTPGHYYYVDGYNADTGKFHVGTSGTDLRGGSEWMSADQINGMPQSGGQARAAIFADHPLAQGQSVAQPGSSQPLTMGTMQPAPTGGTDLLSMLTGNPLANKAQQVMQAVGDVGGQAWQGYQNWRNANAPQGLSDDQFQARMQGAGLQLPGNPLDALSSLGSMSPFGIGEEGEQATQQRNQAIAGANPLRDVPVLGGLSTLAGQAALDPTNLFLAGGPAMMDLGPEAAGSLARSPLLRELLGGEQGTLDLSRLGGQPSLFGDYQPMLPEGGGAGAVPDIEPGRMPQPAPPPGVDPITWQQWLRGVYRGGIVSSPATMLDVASNSGVMPLISYLTGGARDVLGAVPDILGGQGLGPSGGRLLGRQIGTASGIGDLADTFLGQLKPSTLLAENPSSLIGRAQPGLQQIAAYLTEGAGAMHGALSQSARNVVTNGELGAIGGELGASQGLSGQELRAFIQNFIQNPTPEAQQLASGIGARASATQDLGWLSGGIGKAVAKIPDPIGSALFPVYRKGMQLASRAAEFTPIGTLGTAIDAARGLLGKGPYAEGLGSTPAGNTVGPLAERLANNAIGTALGLWLASKADIHQPGGATVTGSWQNLTPDQQDVLRASGQMPNAVQFPDGTWHDASKVPPVFRGPLMIAGAYGDSQHAYDKALAAQGAAGPDAYGVEDPRWAQAEALLNEISTQFTNATPLKNLSSTVDMLTGGGAQAGLQQLVDMPSSILGGLVPGSAIVRSAAQATDPLERQTLRPAVVSQVLPAILQNLQQNLPGQRETLPARVDVLGRQVENPLQGLGALLPLHAAAGQPSPVLDAMQSVGVAPSAAPTAIPFGPTHEITLTPDQKREWETYRGTLLQQIAAPVVQSAQFQQLGSQPFGQLAQQQTLQRLSEQAGAYATRMMTAELAPSAPQTWRLTGRLAPIVGYGPNMLANEQALMQQQALIRGLLGGGLGGIQPNQGQGLQQAYAIAQGP